MDVTNLYRCAGLVALDGAIALTLCCGLKNNT